MCMLKQRGPISLERYIAEEQDIDALLTKESPFSLLFRVNQFKYLEILIVFGFDKHLTFQLYSDYC